MFSIAPQSQQQSGGLQIGFVVADGTGFRNLTPSLGFDYYWPSISPRATKVAAVQQSKLVSFNSDGTGRTVLTDSGVFQVFDAPSAWSPNDRTIAFVSYVGNLNTAPNQISVINSDGTGLTNLTNPGTLQDRNPVWSPDGTKIAFVRNPPFGTTGTSSLMVVSSAGGTPTILLSSNSQSIGSPTWSPTGTDIAFQQGKQVKRVRADGTGLTTLTTPGVDDTDATPNWSSHNQIAFVRSTPIAGGGLTRMLKIIDANGAEIYSTETTDLKTAWSPRGDKLAFGTTGPAGGNIALLTPRTGAITALYSGGFAPTWADPNRNNRHLLGPSGEMSSSATGMVLGTRPGGRANDMPASLTLFDSASTTASLNLTLPTDLNAGTSIAYQVEGKTASNKLSSLVYWNFSTNSPVDVLNGESADGAVVTFDSSTGEVSSVAPYQITARTSGSPKGVKQGADLMIRGSFKAIFDKSGKNIAPKGASEIHYDAVGRLIAVK